MIRALLLAVAAAALLAACAGSQPDRALPADAGEPVLYVALGDSTVEGVGASRAELNYVNRLFQRLRQRYPAARVENLGEGGATSGDVVHGQLERAVALSPHLVTLSVGPNDITGRVPVEQFARHVDTILSKLARRTRAAVVVTLLPDLAVTPRFSGRPEQEAVGRLTVRFNEALRRAAGEHGAQVVDLYGPSRAEVPRRPELVAADGYHPSDAGYARWAELMWQGMEPRITR